LVLEVLVAHHRQPMQQTAITELLEEILSLARLRCFMPQLTVAVMVAVATIIQVKTWVPVGVAALLALAVMALLAQMPLLVANQEVRITGQTQYQLITSIIFLVVALVLLRLGGLVVLNGAEVLAALPRM
jgi:hypothetical protein